MKSRVYELAQDRPLAAICRKAGISQSAVYSWEFRGCKQFKKFYCLSRVLGCHMEDLFEMEDSDLSDYLRKHKEYLNVH